MRTLVHCRGEGLHVHARRQAHAHAHTLELDDEWMNPVDPGGVGRCVVLRGVV